MSIRVIRPSDGSAGVSFSWDCGTVWQPAGALLDVPPGGALESAIGLTNLATLTATQLAQTVSGSDPAATSNA
jgi:hypothetical protein